MGNIVLNVALGRVAYYGSLPAASDALILVPLEEAGLVSDATMRDYATLAAVLAGASNEQTTIGRKTLTNVTVTINDTSDRVEVDADDAVYTTPSGNGLGAMLICYDPDTGAGDDTSIIPLTKHDYVITPEGDSLTVTVADLFRATSTA
jgi:hypothetical protein